MINIPHNRTEPFARPVAAGPFNLVDVFFQFLEILGHIVEFDDFLIIPSKWNVCRISM